MPRKNISLDDAIDSRAEALIQARGFSGLSNLIEVLIREEYERRQPPSIPQMELSESHDSAEAAKKQIVGIVESHYGKAKKRHRSGKSS